jgi:hypothetical protein
MPVRLWSSYGGDKVAIYQNVQKYSDLRAIRLSRRTIPGDKSWDVVVFVSGGILPDGYAECNIRAAVGNAFAMPFDNHIIFCAGCPRPAKQRKSSGRS